MKEFLTDSDKENFSSNNYKINFNQIIIIVIVLTLAIQPFFMDRDNPNNGFMIAVMIVTVLAFSGIIVGAVVLARKKLVTGHFVIPQKILDSVIKEKREVNYAPCEYLGDNYDVVKGVLIFDNIKFEFHGSNIKIEKTFCDIQSLKYETVKVKGISNIVKNIPKRLYLQFEDVELVFVIPEGQKFVNYIDELD